MKTQHTGLIPDGWGEEELLIFKYWAMNYPKAVIAEITKIDIDTVDLRIRHIYLHLDVNSRHEMVQQAWMDGIATREMFQTMARYRKKK